MRPGAITPPSSQSVLSILGTNLHEVWMTGIGLTLSGANIISWRGIKQGFTLQRAAVGREPTYGTDGSFFRGKPVVKFSRAPTLALGFDTLQFNPPLGEPTDDCDLFMVIRCTSHTTVAENQRFPCGLHGYREGIYPDRGFYFTTGPYGSHPGYPSVSAMMGETWNWAGDTNYGHSFPGSSPEDLQPHIYTGGQGRVTPVVYQGSGVTTTAVVSGMVTKDGVLLALSTMWAPTGRIDRFECGLSVSINRGIDMSMAMVGFTRTRLSSQELDSLVRFSRAEWGTP